MSKLDIKFPYTPILQSKKFYSKNDSLFRKVWKDIDPQFTAKLACHFKGAQSELTKRGLPW